MIGFLQGRVAGRDDAGCYLDVGGVGYRLACSTATLAALPEDSVSFRLWTHTYVREDSMALFGFATEAEKRVFEACLTVSGVGPKVALQICSAFAPEAFRRALVTGDIAGISSVPGIGKKTAQRIVIDLKEKLDLPDLELVGSTPDTVTKARSALENLGYSPAEVREVLSGTQLGAGDTVEDVVKRALKALA